MVSFFYTPFIIFLLINGGKNMGKLIDETNHRYGRLVALYSHKVNNKIVWRCQCDCGNQTDVPGTMLRSGNTKSCGCLQKEKASKSLIDLTGKKFGLLTVLGRDESKPKGHQKRVYWICKCECGNHISVQGYDLKRGHTKSCGCYIHNNPSLNKIDEVSHKYGKLTVLKEYGKNEEGRTLWLCKCDCGNDYITLGKTLRAGLVNSCGCMKSKGEEKIALILQKLNINFKRQYTFEDCRNPKTDYKLFFDFYLPDYNLCIEYQGEQHTKEIDFFKGSLQEIQFRDKLKEDYCKNNKIKLVKISFTDFSKLDETYIKEVILG